MHTDNNVNELMLFLIIIINVIEAVILTLICPYGANCQGKETCGSSLEMRRAALVEQLATVDCENYNCSKLHKEHLQQGGL